MNTYQWGIYNLKQCPSLYHCTHNYFILFFGSQREPFNWPTINTIGTCATPQHRSQNTLLSLKYNHVLWCFPLALTTSMPMTSLFTTYIHWNWTMGKPYGIKKKIVVWNILGTHKEYFKNPTHLRWMAFSSTLGEHFWECLTPMVTLHMKTSSYFAFALWGKPLKLCIFYPIKTFLLCFSMLIKYPLFSRNWVNLIVKNQNTKIISINDVGPNLNIIMFGFPCIRKDFLNQ
jgi:hypothetical protein